MRKIIVGANNHLLGHGLRSLLEDRGHRGASIAATEQAIAAAKDPDVGLLILEIETSDGRMVAQLRDLRARRRGLRIILLAEHGDVRASIATGSAEIQGLIFKTTPLDQVAECISMVVAGACWIDERHQPSLLTLAHRADSDRTEALLMLTPREWEILALVVDRVDNARIGTALDISTSTVKVHLHSIYKKFGATDRRDLLLKLEGAAHGIGTKTAGMRSGRQARRAASA